MNKLNHLCLLLVLLLFPFISISAQSNTAVTNCHFEKKAGEMELKTAFRWQKEEKLSIK